MSRERYLQALHCQNPTVIPHQVWISHPQFFSDLAGVDYHAQPATASRRFHQRYDVDNGGPLHLDDTPLAPPPQPGQTADGGVQGDEAFHTVWYTESPFREPEELWNFDPDPWGKDADRSLTPGYAVKNYQWCFQPETWAERRRQEDAGWAKLEAAYPGKFTDARGFYCTTFMWGICLFGWDVFLMALGLDPHQTGQTLQRLGDVTAKMYEYFASCPASKFVVPHDDICMTQGPVTSAEWYRRYIFPQYEKIFAPVRAAGQPVIFMSDGNITELAADIAPLVDGFIFESSTPPDPMFQRFGRDKCLVGGVNLKVLTFGTPAEVEQEVRRAIARGRDCPGFVMACTDTIPENVPLPNVYAYFDTFEKHRRR